MSKKLTFKSPLKSESEVIVDEAPKKPVKSLPKGVCVKVESLRSSNPRYDNLEEWSANPANLLVCRGGRVFITCADKSKHIFPYQGSPWANPFKLSEYSLDESLVRYQAHLDNLLRDQKMKREFLLLLDKAELGCFCGPKDRCHRDVILRKLESLITDDSK